MLLLLVLVLVITVIILILLILALASPPANISDEAMSAVGSSGPTVYHDRGRMCQTLPTTGDSAALRGPKWSPSRAYVRYIRYSFRLPKCLRKR
jgi:hypothetical protein